MNVETRCVVCRAPRLDLEEARASGRGCGRSARAAVETEYSWEAISARLVKLYQQVLEG